MQKISKSWAVTLTAFILAIAAPILDGPAADYGIIISEKDLEHFLYLVLGIGATGAAAKRGKKLTEKKTPIIKPAPKPEPTPEPAVKPADEPIDPKPEQPPATPARARKLADKRRSLEFTPPKWEDSNGWFQTNLEHTKDVGATLPYGAKFLYVRVPHMKDYIGGQIWRDDTFIQAEQCQDESRTIRFELYESNKQPLRPAKYTVKVDIDRPAPVNEHTEFEFTIV